jgi:hypothetical protein
MQVSDSFFVGRVGWAEQILYSVQIIERANREFRHPRIINGQLIEESVTWAVAAETVNIKADFYTIPQLLVNNPTLARRVRAYTPTRAIDVGIDRDLVVPFTGVPIQPDLMVEKAIDTLEERTAYLLSAKLIYDSLVSEWNGFADLQENLWLKIYKDEGLVFAFYDPKYPGANYTFSHIAGLAGLDLASSAFEIPPYKPNYIRDVSRATYEGVITQWLLDAGITARSGGQAVDNDSYILWLANQLSKVTASASAIAQKPIDPRYTYRFNPVLPATPNASSDSGGGVTGVPDKGNNDPAEPAEKNKDLLEELAGRENPLTAELSGGADTTPINTLPEC